MRILIAGQKRFGRAILDLAVRRGHEIAAVACPSEEGDQLLVGAINRGLPILHGHLSSAMMPAGVDLIVAAHCHTFLSEKTRLRSELGALGFHPSLLPRHRGRSAIEWAIRMGEKITGGSLYWLKNTVDGGPLAAQSYCFIRKDDTASSLWRRELFPMGVRLFEEAFEQLERGVVVASPQNPDHATWEPAIDSVPPLKRNDLPMLGSSRFRIVTDPREVATQEEEA